MSFISLLAVPPTEINQEHQYKRYDNNFPVPKLENVYKAWKPVDHGHPLRDETLFYAPPSMERVRFQHENQGPQSRSIDDEVFTGGVPKGAVFFLFLVLNAFQHTNVEICKCFSWCWQKCQISGGLLMNLTATFQNLISI